MTFAEKMKGLAKTAAKNLVLAEGLEPRTVKAARKISAQKSRERKRAMALTA